MQLSFEIVGEKQLSRNLRLLNVNIKNLKEFFGDAIEIIHKKSNSIFKNNGSNIKKAPKRRELSFKTKRAREKKRGYYKKTPNNPGILRWTGNLQDNITKKITNDYGMLKYNAKYAIYHQKGGKKFPKRVIIDLDNNTNTKIIKKLQEKINRDIKIFGKQV